jgi:hypothetical protein
MPSGWKAPELVGVKKLFPPLNSLRSARLYPLEAPAAAHIDELLLRPPRGIPLIAYGQIRSGPTHVQEP